jgi:hypothetical protein
VNRKKPLSSELCPGPEPPSAGEWTKGNFCHPPRCSPEFGLYLQESELRDYGIEGFCSLFTAHCSLFAAHCSLFTVRCFPEFGLYLQDEASSEKHEAAIRKRKVFGLLFFHCSLFTTHYSLFTTHYSLFTAHCSLPVRSANA